MNERIGAVMEKCFDKILPIPKTPKLYTPPPPEKPLSWIPHGTLDNPTYMERLENYASEIKYFDTQRTKRMKYSSRGWAYLLEGIGKITKNEFDVCAKAINDCRKSGYLPINFVAEDQDTTRHISGIHKVANPAAGLEDIQEDITSFLEDLPSSASDYWNDEKYYLMMVVEKGDIMNLFQPICKEYHIPIASSKGWAPIQQRADIAELSTKAEERGLIPVLLMFYDHDPAGMKITDTYLKNLMDIEPATGWDPYGLIIDRFGLNAEDIEKYNLMWIDNLRTSSGREANAPDYIRKYGRRKCEANALFKNDETLAVGEAMCRNAIEKYYGEDALERFAAKEEVQREKYSEICDDPLWDEVNGKLSKLITELSKEETQSQDEELSKPVEIDVEVNADYFGVCPKCKKKFDYGEDDMDKWKICRGCGASMRLKSAS